MAARPAPQGLAPSRGRHDQPRCGACALPPGLCLCAEVRPLALATRVLVFLHRREVHKTTNTARLASLALSRCELCVVGLPEDRRHYAPLRGATRTLLLFPSERSVPLEPAHAQDGPLTLVVPDGNWRQARRMAVGEPELAALPAVHLADGAPRRFELRRHPEGHRLSTFEAIARALGVLEGPAVQRELERLLALKVERVLATRNGQVGRA